MDRSAPSEKLEYMNLRDKYINSTPSTSAPFKNFSENDCVFVNITVLCKQIHQFRDVVFVNIQIMFVGPCVIFDDLY